MQGLQFFAMIGFIYILLVFSLSQGVVARDVEPVMPILFTPVHKGGDRLNLVLWKGEEHGYHQIVRKFCFDYQLSATSCDDLLQHTERQISNPRPLRPEEVCSEGVTISQCYKAVIEAETQRRTLFDTLDMKVLEGYSEGLDLSHLQSLVKLRSILLGRECTTSRGDTSHPPDDVSRMNWEENGMFLVPCNTMKWVTGRWHFGAQSQHEGPSLSRCPKGDVLNVNSSNRDTEWNFFCRSFFPKQNRQEIIKDGFIASKRCIVVSLISYHSGYSFELEKWAYDTFGCTVHILNVNRSVSFNEAERVEFPFDFNYFDDSNISGYKDANLSALIEYSGAEGSDVDLVKVDCNGCEWSVLTNWSVEYPKEIEKICNIATNLHVCPNKNMSNSDLFREMNKMAHFVNDYVLSGTFKLSYVRYHKEKYDFEGRESRDHRYWKIFSVLEALQFDPSVCVYEVIFVNEKCLTDRKTSGVEYSQNKLLLQDPDRDVDIFGETFSTMDNFAEMHRYLSLLNATVAVLSIEPNVHSEIIGPFVDLCYDLGFARVLVYYDIYDEELQSDAQFKYFPRYGSMVPVSMGWETWDIRPPEHCFLEKSDWHFLLMLTGDEIYKNNIWVERIKTIPNRILSLQHHPSWVVPSLYKKNMFLTPFEGHSRFVFPFLRISPHVFEIKSGYQNAIRYEQLPFELGQYVLILGSIGDVDLNTRHSVDRKYKDMHDIISFLEHSPQNKVVNVVKFSGDPFEKITTQYPSQAIMFFGIHSYDVVKIASRSRFLWVPVREDSLYLKGSFASSISFAFALGKILIMPRSLSNLYELHGCVVEYNTSITEVDLNSVDQNSIKQRMIDWERAQRIQNVANVYKCFLSDDSCLL